MLGPYPGEINAVQDLKELCLSQEKVMQPSSDLYGFYSLKPSAKEG